MARWYSLRKRWTRSSAPGTTVYIASEHYRHPTVAALAKNYPQAKWLTGGATLVLPPKATPSTSIPRTQSPPAPWPDAITRAWTSTSRLDPDGAPALWMHRRRSDGHRSRYVRPIPPPTSRTSSTSTTRNRRRRAVAAVPCPVLVTWEALAPVLRRCNPSCGLLHPITGEWTREMAFHYPPDQWTVGRHRF